MKLYLSIILLVFLMPYSCSTEVFAPNLLVTGENGYNFVQSQKEWKTLKKRHQDSYRYTVLELSFSGFGSETTVTVIDGKVVSREYEAFQMSEDDGSKEVLNSYFEEGEDIGSHSEGWPAYDMDKMYTECGSDYLMVDPETHTLYFDTTEEGVMTLCGNVPDLCGDDCFEGFSMSEFEWMK
ncbi:hypothetical protein SAMN04488034_102281 [Salinimicrobium catena]|uniref:Uncharacterized protein n=1 Tax=Salinimicrobium catena TaxID=390640 RepID=A0A1H5LI39_9FLAO|nr:hypothetical protein [Salinimicrobium catena]SDL09891.1 hypothetical protein SAMN04488140_102281 [Salinimicrobium catena]SEE76187.1 hypothetical protein SAMN04488034_102281 [Salinimicrobium catena]